MGENRGPGSAGALFFGQLEDLRHRAGNPPFAEIAKELGFSPNTMTHLFTHHQILGWRAVRAVVQLLGRRISRSDETVASIVRQFQQLWANADAAVNDVDGTSGRRTHPGPSTPPTTGASPAEDLRPAIAPMVGTFNNMAALGGIADPVFGGTQNLYFGTPPALSGEGGEDCR